MDKRKLDKELEKIDELQSKIDLVNNLISVKNSDGSQYFSTDWVNENILGIKDKAKARKIKIKRILKDE